MCCSSEQRYNFLKANHNHLVVEAINKVLFVRTKIQFFESKSQPMQDVSGNIIGCSSEQRYNFLKANHNRSLQQLPRALVVRQNKDTSR